jgi:manganese transport protein
MGEFVIPLWQKIGSWLAAIIIISLNVRLVFGEISDLLNNQSNAMLIAFTVVPICVFCFFMLIYIALIPLITKEKTPAREDFHSQPANLQIDQTKTAKRIGVTVDFSSSDNKAINKAIQLGNKQSILVLIHVLESTNAMVYGENAFDHEREEDFQKLKNYQLQLEKEQINTEIQLGFGDPKNAIPLLLLKNECDMLVMGTHGHRTLKDLILGSTIENVRHEIKVPLVLV